MNELRALLAPAGAPAASCLAATEDPHAELLALVWGSRFDREHARELLARQPQALGALWPSLQAAADRFDRLAPAHQQRLRRAIVRHQGRWDNAVHAPHPAD